MENQRGDSNSRIEYRAGKNIQKFVKSSGDSANVVEVEKELIKELRKLYLEKKYNKKRKEEVIRFNVSGVKYDIQISDIMDKPGTLLWEMTMSCKDQNNKKPEQCICIDRDNAIFEYIVQWYRDKSSKNISEFIPNNRFKHAFIVSELDYYNIEFVRKQTVSGLLQKYCRRDPPADFLLKMKSLYRCLPYGKTLKLKIMLLNFNNSYGFYPFTDEGWDNDSIIAQGFTLLNTEQLPVDESVSGRWIPFPGAETQFFNYCVSFTKRRFRIKYINEMKGYHMKLESVAPDYVVFSKSY